jgi:endonuclease YncB( thermonuclease family)
MMAPMDYQLHSEPVMHPISHDPAFWTTHRIQKEINRRKAFRRLAGIAAMIVTSVCAMVLTTAGESRAAEIRGKVVAIEDGDTLTLLDEQRKQHKIRLTDIDAPETRHGSNRPSQPFSAASQKSLAEMVFSKDVRANCYEEDRYSRSVCRIFLGDMDVNLEQIRRGYAWAPQERRYVRDPRAYSLMAEARSARRGLWSEADPVAPWMWRKACWNDGQCARQGQ